MEAFACQSFTTAPWLFAGGALIGNDLGNSLVGEAGVDTLTGGAGSDTLDGGGDADSMAGGIDDDTYLVDSASDVTTELADEGSREQFGNPR